MSFLDNLENSLKSMEGKDEDAADNRKQRDLERTAALAAAPAADSLKKGPYTQELLKQATRAGFQMRAKVQIVWLGTLLRLEAKEKKLELRPLPEGIFAYFFENGLEIKRRRLDLREDPSVLVSEWLG